MNNIVRLFALLIALAAIALAQPAHVEQWGMYEVSLQSTTAHANPFADVQLQCRFTSGDRNVDVDGFYDGGQTWRIRFMPDQPGPWTYTTTSNDPQLNAKSGSLTIEPPSKNNHGPIVVKNTYHFAYADGTPFFPLGTTAYAWLNRNPQLEEQTLQTLSQQAFNKLRFLVFPKWFMFNEVEPPMFPYEKRADGTFDLDRFDPAFFRHYEARILDLQRLGIQADIILFHPYDKWGFSRMDPAHDRAYLRYVVARSSAFRNIWWTMTNEFDAYPKQKDWRSLGELVERSDPYHHLRGIHNCCIGFYDNSEPWVTHTILQDITAQRWQTNASDRQKMALDARKIGKPVLIDEYGYEGNIPAPWGNLGPREALEIHWAFTMAGAYGSHGETYDNPGHLLWWSTGGKLVGDSPARLAFLKQIMSEAPYTEMEPAPDAIKGGNDSMSALAKRGSYYLFYFAQTKERPDWNIGVFGPATPSKPLPITHGLPPFKFPPPPEFVLGDGIFRVDMIDTWNMKVYPLGYTDGPSQKFLPEMAPGLMRFVKVDHAEPGKPHGTVGELFKAFGNISK